MPCLGRKTSILLIAAYAVMAVGSVWHVHVGHEDCQETVSCPWCLAAAAASVMALAITLPLLGGMPAGFALPDIPLTYTTRGRGSWSSRAPPVPRFQIT